MKLEQCYIGQIVGITVNGDTYIGAEMMESFKGWNGHYSMINHNARNNKKTKGGK